MKKILYITTALLIFTSCRSIDKMIESGNYDQALRYGVDKLRGEKNKKTKYVKGLEKAYAKLNRSDINTIKRLKLSGNRNSLDRVVHLYQKMEDRQNYIYPLLPLISEDGYPATFKVQDYSILINETMKDASEVHYLIAKELLIESEKYNDKLSARKAYNELEEATSYFDSYKDSHELKQQAYHLGQTYILVEPYVSGSNAAFSHTSDIISQIQLNKLNTKWKKFYTHDTDQRIDYVATIEVAEIIPGKEIERYNSFTNTKEVNGKLIPVKDRNGNVVKDTSGQIIYTENKIVVSANVEELMREKIAQMSGKVTIVNAINNNHISSIPINVSYLFEDYSCIFRGDKRALTDIYSKRIKEYCAPFPTDYEMTTNLAYEYKNAAEETIRKENLI